MEWLFGLALLPALLCGLMCIGGVVLAAVGLRRTTTGTGCDTARSSASDDESVTTTT